MALLPEPTNTTAAAIHALYARRNAAQEQRAYLGWSQIGKPCDRALWYSFRLSGGKPVEGRIARLFDTGHREEARVIDDLRAIGCEVWDIDPNTGEQFAVSSVGGHLRGHADCVVLGLPEAPKTPHLVDVKTINAKKFDELLKKGIHAMYPEYIAQGIGYCGHLKLTRAMFIFVCKNDDRIHCERFDFDQAAFELLMERAERIVRAIHPPERISNDPEHFVCRFCEHSSVCHGTDVPEPTCRTCVHVTPEINADARWSCVMHKKDLTLPEQKAGCGEHRYLPILLERFAKPVDVQGNDVHYRLDDGAGEFVNGARPGYSSREIAACEHKTMLADEQLVELRGQWSGTVTA